MSGRAPLVFPTLWASIHQWAVADTVPERMAARVTLDC
jgi:hypothetical protein